MPDNIISIGIDLSLTGTGVVVLKDGKIIEQKLIKSKPKPDGKPVDEVLRIKKIVKEIELIISTQIPNIAVIENLAFGVRNATALTQLAALSYFTRSMLIDHNISFVLIAPNSLKKFITGNGAAKKDEMMLATYKRYGVSITENNICDGYGLSQVGLALLNGNSKEITKLQEEVLFLLRKQL